MTQGATLRKPTLALIGTKGIPFFYSGYETFVYELSQRLKDRYEIHVYCHRALFSSRPSKKNGIYMHYLPAVESKYLTHPTHGAISTLHALFQNYDLYFYLNSCNGIFGWILKLLGKRTVLNTDGLEWERPQLNGLAAAYYYWASKQGAKYFQTLIADSQAMADHYRNEFGVSSEVIAYGANISQQEARVAMEKWALAKESYYLVVGRLIPDNNADTIIEGFRRSKSNRKLVIVGDLLFSDPYARKIKRNASEQIIFAGFIKDAAALRGLFQNAFAYLHGHEFGGTNPTLLEALVSRCCVLALDTVFNREVLSNDEYGLLFLKDPDSIASLIRLIENDPSVLNRYRKKAINRIESDYTWGKIASQYDDLFQRILNSSASSEKSPSVTKFD